MASPMTEQKSPAQIESELQKVFAELNTCQDFGLFARNVRNALGATQRTVANAYGCDSEKIYRLEGHKYIEEEKLTKWLDAIETLGLSNERAAAIFKHFIIKTWRDLLLLAQKKDVGELQTS